MTDWKTRLALSAQWNRQEIVRARLSRRDMVRFGLPAAGGGLAVEAGLSSRTFGRSVVPASPPATPWAQPMPTLPVEAPVAPAALVWGAPDGTTPADRATRRVNHPPFAFDPATRAYGGGFPPRRFYESFAQEAAWRFHPSYSPSPVWGFDGRVPGPALQARYGEPVPVRFHKRLPSIRVAQDFPTG